MREKEKAYLAFEKLLKREIDKTKTALEKKVIKKMNAVDNDGNVYTSESEIMDAYAYDMITDAERRRLLTALEYREYRPKFKEDHYISLCEKGLSIIESARCDDRKKEKEKIRNGKISEIYGKGNQPRFCICCGEIIGEVLGGSIIGTNWYDNHRECAEGHACKECADSCRGRNSCIRREAN